MQARLENLLEPAAQQAPSYADFLDASLHCEVEARRARYLRAHLQLAHLPFVKAFEQFDFNFQPSIDERRIRELLVRPMGQKLRFLGARLFIPTPADRRFLRLPTLLSFLYYPLRPFRMASFFAGWLVQAIIGSLWRGLRHRQ